MRVRRSYVPSLPWDRSPPGAINSTSKIDYRHGGVRKQKTLSPHQLRQVTTDMLHHVLATEPMAISIRWTQRLRVDPSR